MIKNIKALANRAWESHAARVQRRADYWLLNNMSARDLRDLGITRCEIRQRVYGSKLN